MQARATTTLEKTLAGLELAVRAATREGIAAEEFEGIVRQHQQRIYRVVLGMVRDPDAADTLTQECFLRAYQNRKGFRGDSSIGAWLVRIAINLARDHARSRKKAFWRFLYRGATAEDGLAAADTVHDPQATPEQRFAAREELEAVWSVMDVLSPQQRAVFVLRFAEEMTLEEIARTLTLDVGTVKSHLYRAVGAVRKHFRKKDSDARTYQR